MITIPEIKEANIIEIQGTDSLNASRITINHNFRSVNGVIRKIIGVIEEGALDGNSQFKGSFDDVDNFINRTAGELGDEWQYTGSATTTISDQTLSRGDIVIVNSVTSGGRINGVLVVSANNGGSTEGCVTNSQTPTPLETDTIVLGSGGDTVKPSVYRISDNVEIDSKIILTSRAVNEHIKQAIDGLDAGPYDLAKYEDVNGVLLIHRLLEENGMVEIIEQDPLKVPILRKVCNKVLLEEWDEDEGVYRGKFNHKLGGNVIVQIYDGNMNLISCGIRNTDDGGGTTEITSDDQVVIACVIG